MIYLKQSTASQEIPLGPFVDSTDGDTEETGLTIANTDILIWKTGATTLPAKNSGGATHISGGIYYAVLDATDTNTLGPMVIYVHMAGALYVFDDFEVITSAAYDIRTGTTALGAVSDFFDYVVENSKSFAEMIRIMKAAVAGKTTTGGTVFRDDADAKARITATVDASNNRTAMTLDGS